MPPQHPLLRRQLAAHGDPALAASAAFQRFAAAVNHAYEQSDLDRTLLERSLELSSQELLQANADMRAVMQGFPDLFLWVAPDGTVLGCRAQDSSDLLLPSDSQVGKRLQNIPDPAASDVFTRAMAQIAAGDRLVTVEYTLRLGDGPRHYEARLVRMEADQILVIVRNITARHRAEVALEQSVSVLEATLESTADGILVVDLNGRITRFNQKFVDLWQIPQAILETRDDAQALGHVVDLVADPEDFLAKVRSLYEQPEVESFDEVHLKDGRVLERYSMAQRIGGRAVGRVWSFRDVTERRRAEATLLEREKELRQSQKMEAVGLLAGGIAHDFNNLLTAITGYAELLLDGIRPDHRFRRDIEEIHKAGRSAAALTQQLLAFGRRQVLRPSILDLNAVAARVNGLLRRLIGEDIELVFQPSQDLRRVSADPGQMEQIIMNLAINARDAMPHGGTLTIGTTNVTLDRPTRVADGDVGPGPFVALTIRDTGVGIPDRDLPHIFEPFFTTKVQGEGTGLGLATVYGIVQQSGGAINVESEAGRGTTFTIYLPVAGQSRDESSSPAPAAVPRGRETVLIAEDQPEVRAVTRAILERHGYTVLDAASAEQAIQIAKEHPHVDLLVTDVVMPHMNGRELAERLHESRPELRVIYVSGYLGDRIIREGIIERGLAFLQKPFSAAELLSRVHQVLDGRV